MNINDNVTLKPPFSLTYPGVYEIIALAEATNTYTVDIFNDGTGSDFYIDYLEAV